MKLPFTIFLLFIAFLSYSQFPENFEFLNHSSRFNSPGASINMGDSIIFVSHNGQPEMTELKVLYNDYNLDSTIFHSYLSSQSRVYNNADGSHDIFIYTLVDYDVTLPGFYAIHVDKSEITIDTFVEDWSNEFYHFAIDVVKDSMSHHWVIDYNTIVRYTDQEPDLEIDINVGYSSKFIKTIKGDIYVVSSSDISHLTENSLLPVRVLDDTFQDHFETEQGNYLMFEDSIVLYSLNFDAVLQKWPISSDLENKRFISVEESNIQFYAQDGTQYFMLELDPQGALDTFYYEMSEYETVSGIDVLSDSSYLVKGFYTLENIFYNTFFRSVSRNKELHYTRFDLDLDEFKLHRTGTDSTFRYVNAQGDSVFTYSTDYDFSILCTNNSDSILNISNIYSRDYFTFFDPGGPHFSLTLSDISPFEQKSYEGSFTTIRTNSIQNIKIAAPGVNYRFNKSPYFTIVADYSSSLSNPSFYITQRLYAYPNPSTDRIYWDQQCNACHYRVVDNLGRLITSGPVDDNSVDVSRLGTGTYYLLLQNDEDSYLAPFVKM